MVNDVHGQNGFEEKYAHNLSNARCSFFYKKNTENITIFFLHYATCIDNYYLPNIWYVEIFQ